MITIEMIKNIEKNDLQEISDGLEPGDLPFLVDCLSEKDDKIRYPALQLLELRSESHADVVLFWDHFKEKLKSENSYQRSIGLMLIAANARWDTDNRMSDTIDDYLKLLNDEKPITVRQCIQALRNIIPYKKELRMMIADQLMRIDILTVRETMRKSILTDILNILILIRQYQSTDSIETYITNAITGGLLDRKTAKQIQELL